MVNAPATTVEDDKVVPIFQTYEQVQREQHDILAEHYAAWCAAGDIWKATIAALNEDGPELAKYDAPQATLAKAEAVRLLKRNYGLPSVARIEATIELHKQLQTITIKRNERLFGLSTVAKRSARFASARRRNDLSGTLLSFHGK